LSLETVIGGLGGDGFQGDGSDYYEVDLAEGETLTVHTETPLDLPGMAINDLDPALVLFNPAGAPIANDSDGQDGKNALLSHTATSAGTYRIQVLAEAGSGEYVLRDDRPAVNELARVTVDAEDADPLARLHVTIGFGDGTVEGDDNTLHAWTEPGVYRVCATVDDGLTRVLGVKEVEVGKPRRLIPKLKAKLDLDDAGRDKLDLRLRMPVDLPVGTDLAGMLLEMDVVASNDDSVIAVATAVTLDVSGRGEADGAMVSLRHRSDLWKLKLKLRRQDFETAEGPREDSAWNFRDEDHPVPATIRVRLDGAMLWTTTVELRYDSKRNRKGKLR